MTKLASDPNQLKDITLLEHRFLDAPFIPEHLLAGIDGFDTELGRAIGRVIETDVGVFRYRDAAIHRQHQIVALPDLEVVDEERRYVEPRALFHLQSRILRVAKPKQGL